MPQLTDDCFAHGGGMMSIEAALDLFRARVGAVDGTERVPLGLADGRVLAEAIRAAVALPAFANSAVDGYAVRHADIAPEGMTRLAVVDRLQAGDRALRPVGPGEAARIFTGAPMPPGADTVYMQEDTRAEGGAVLLPPGLKRGANSRPAGEEIEAGSPALPAGRRLRPQDLALAAGVGQAEVVVRRRLRVAVFSTGNEVVEPGAARGPAQVFDTNRLMLAGLLGRLGVQVTDLGILRDEPGPLAEALARAGAGHDLVLTTGGVSTGEADHVKDAVEAVGRLDVWRFAIKPGRPLALGTLGGAAFMGLPGNPVAVYVTFAYVVRGLVAALSGETWAPPVPVPVVSGFSYAKRTGRTEFVRVHLDARTDGAPVARKFEREGAGIISSLTEAAGLVVLGEEVAAVAPGEPLGFVPFAALG
ncbi:molybdopterin molybdotransferase MoeA [Prosthecomicrobium sp. N25]|uniref:molybdopterin molybdotransferase MoeA n=1 Tax=Prosthecomicrobium sp. N25 TaxID=3129254 RepID=UPI003076C28D